MITQKQEKYYLDYVRSESYKEVADKHGVNRSTVYEAVSKVQEEISRVEEIKRQREIATEVIQDV
jgi:predicted DNA-binding protein YlxM (UPF0122 family)